jgi:hypothetical protein
MSSSVHIVLENVNVNYTKDFGTPVAEVIPITNLANLARCVHINEQNMPQKNMVEHPT